MENNFEVIPYNSVGDIKFGMKKKQLETLFGEKPSYVHKNTSGRTDMRWGNISVKLDPKGIVNEVSFTEGDKKPVYNGQDLLNVPLNKIFDKLEKPFKTVGFEVYFSVGIATTGLGKSKESKTVSIFAESLVERWKM